MIKYKLFCNDCELKFDSWFSSSSEYEKLVAEYMKGENIDINVDLFTGKRNFTAFTMDFTKNYIEINSDYRS